MKSGYLAVLQFLKYLVSDCDWLVHKAEGKGAVPVRTRCNFDSAELGVSGF
jgi:hypothetical protein